MTRKFKIINNHNFPSDKEVEEITKRVSAPNYPYKNYVLPPNAKNEARIKYNLCQSIGFYQLENNLTDEELMKRLGIEKNKDKLIDILFSKIYNLNLGELITYTDNLHIPFEIKITNQSEIKHLEIK